MAFMASIILFYFIFMASILFMAFMASIKNNNSKLKKKLTSSRIHRTSRSFYMLFKITMERKSLKVVCLTLKTCV